MWPNYFKFVMPGSRQQTAEELHVRWRGPLFRNASWAIRCLQRYDKRVGLRYDGTLEYAIARAQYIYTDWSLTYRYMYILDICCRGWAFKAGICWRLNNYISNFSQHICDFSSKKQCINIPSLRLYTLLYLLKVYPSLWISARNQGTPPPPPLSYFRHF